MEAVIFIIRFIRYRFFLFAGIFPYLLGQAVAFNSRNSLNWRYFCLGFLGIFLVLAGVEMFNEYFDAKEGGDRIFSTQKAKVPHHFLPLGLLACFLAFLIGVYFSIKVGLPVLLFCLLGFLAAYFYVGPPLKWAYRGLGELVISISYGPFMVVGSNYLQTGRIDVTAFFVSLICAVALFSLAILNEMPDYYQDRLVGKRNLVVRFGKSSAVKILWFSFTFLFALLAIGFLSCKIPSWGLLGFFTMPWILKSLNNIRKDPDNPKVYRLAVNTNVITYLVIVVSLGMGYIL